MCCKIKKIIISSQENRIKKEDYKLKSCDQTQSNTQYYKYVFITEPNEFSLICDKDYLLNLIKSQLSAKYSEKIKSIKELETVNPNEFIENIKGYRNGDQKNIFEFYEDEINKKIDENFNLVNYITINNEKHNMQKLSFGTNSIIYFDLLSKSEEPGIYIVDQPEDDVSQQSIKKLITSFREIAKKRQIIFVTHNPQLVVNLDVDNVIFLSKEKNGKLSFKYGAIEYKDNQTNVLDIIVDNMEGGRDALKERYKKYGNNN